MNHVNAPGYVPLHLETRSVVDTATAAFHLNRQPQTLREWSSRSSGPIHAVRIGGRLGWRVADLRALVGGGA